MKDSETYMATNKTGEVREFFFGKHPFITK